MNLSDDRLTQLRLRELAGTLTPEEQDELAALLNSFESDEQIALMHVITKLQTEQTMLEERLESLQTDNEELASLLNQQEQLVSEAKVWLQNFHQRHHKIQQTYTRLTGEVLHS